MNKKLKRYIEIKAEIKKLSLELKDLDGDVFARVLEEDGERLVTEKAEFKIAYRVRWKYSNELLEKEKDFKYNLKVQKAKEERSGKAEKLSDGGYLVVKIKKND